MNSVFCYNVISNDFTKKIFYGIHESFPTTLPGKILLVAVFVSVVVINVVVVIVVVVVLVVVVSAEDTEPKAC